jgi:hypothetical protein
MFMINLYYWTTPNGHKITIFLEESGLPYQIIPINIGKGEQFESAFLAISPNNKIPAIVDQAPVGGVSQYRFLNRVRFYCILPRRAKSLFQLTFPVVKRP